MATSWTYYCDIINRYKLMLLENIDDVFYYWNNNDIDRERYFELLLKKYKLGPGNIDNTKLGLFSCIYTHSSTFSKIDKVNITDIDLLKDIIKYRCAVAVATKKNTIINKYNEFLKPHEAVLLKDLQMPFTDSNNILWINTSGGHNKYNINLDNRLYPHSLYLINNNLLLLEILQEKMDMIKQIQSND